MSAIFKVLINRKLHKGPKFDSFLFLMVIKQYHVSTHGNVFGQMQFSDIFQWAFVNHFLSEGILSEKSVR